MWCRGLSQLYMCKYQLGVPIDNDGCVAASEDLCLPCKVDPKENLLLHVNG